MKQITQSFFEGWKSDFKFQHVLNVFHFACACLRLIVLLITILTKKWKFLEDLLSETFAEISFPF